MLVAVQEFGARFHHTGSVHPWFGLLFWFLFAGLVAVAVWLFVRSTHEVRVEPVMGPSSDPAMGTLRTRFAQGEIDTQEFATRAAYLSGQPAPPPSTPEEPTASGEIPDES